MQRWLSTLQCSCGAPVRASGLGCCSVECPDKRLAEGTSETPLMELRAFLTTSAAHLSPTSAPRNLGRIEGRINNQHRWGQAVERKIWTPSCVAPAQSPNTVSQWARPLVK
uniref:Putative secreted protein n=1 Tax=Ixodes ricinus TaxID=34613 RepID=A0A6B0UJK7_IXORI